jgi:signal recognition particle receptor subunit beta
MSFINFQAREVNCKIVYYGPGLVGKTTNLQYIYNKTNPEARGKLISLETETERTLFFDFVPLSLGELPGGFRTRFHLYTVPGPVFYDVSRKLILKGVDGIIFVADSQRARHEANLGSLEDLTANLEANQDDISRIPFALQYNKRDLPTAMSIEEMDDALRIHPWDRFDAVAPKGFGVFETLKSVARQILAELKRSPPP